MAFITVSGTQGIGKTTFIGDFLAQWPSFKTPNKTYRDVISERGLSINKNVNKESQRIILDSIIESMNSHSRTENVIFDRCPLDNLVYTLWAYEKGVGDIDEEFVSDCINVTREALQNIDLMLMIPITSQNAIELEDDGLRDADPVYQQEIDELFQGLKRLRDNGDNAFFVKDDCSPIIEVFGNRHERIEICKLYLDEGGSFYGEEDSMLYDAQGDIINDNVNDLIDTGERDLLRKQLGLDEMPK
jgi:predicted ATPase